MRLHKLKLFFSILAIAFILQMSLLINYSIAQTTPTCTPPKGNAGYFMGIAEFKFGDFFHNSDWQGTGGHQYYSGNYIEVKPGENYSWEVKFCGSLTPVCTYPQGFSLWIDLNQNGTFEASERLYHATTLNANGYSGNITIPDGAKTGLTYMRIISHYANQVVGPCDTYHYGDAYSYIVDVKPKAPDAAVVALSVPNLPMPIGTHTLGCTIRNSGDELPFSSVTIRWSINNIQQPPVYWTGYLEPGQTANVTLGQYNFQYPLNGPFNPFQFRAWTEAPDGNIPDGDASNDSRQQNLAAILDDAGIQSVVSPIAEFTPGNYPVTVRLHNYGPRPLTSANIHWRVDGVNMNTYEWSGNITYGSYQDVTLGNHTFQYKTPLAPYSVTAWTSMPNGVEDLISSNDQQQGSTMPLLTPYDYRIGGSGSHFSTLKAFTDYLNTYGVQGNGHIDVEIAAGIYSGPFELLNIPHGNNSFTFRSASGENDVRLQHTPGQGSPYVLNVAGLDNIEFHNINFIAQGGTALVNFNNSNNLEFKSNTFRGVVNSPQSNNYNLISISNASDISITNSSLIDGSTGLSIVNGDGDLTFENNLVSNPSNYGIYAHGVNVSILYNRYTNNQLSNKTGFELIECSGIVADNLVSANNLQALVAIGSKGLNFYYNTFLSNNNNMPTTTIIGGENEFTRNMFVNMGQAPAISFFEYFGEEEGEEDMTSFVGNGNNYYTTGANTFEYYFEELNSLSTWQTRTGTDHTSFSEQVQYEGTGNPVLSRINSDLVLGTPLSFDPEMHKAIQEKDFNGNNRNMYLMGAEDVVLKPEITMHPREVIACEDDMNKNLSVAATLGYGILPEYQWYLDGYPIPGETKPILELPALEFGHSGVYQARVMAPKNLDHTMSKPAAVYVVTETEIVEQPNSVYIDGTNEYIISVKAHARFLPPDFVFDYQWYRWSEGLQRATPLTNDMHYTGVHTDQLRISNPQSQHYTNDGDYYFVEVRGLCDMVQSERAILSETPLYGVSITNQLQESIVLCSDDNLSLNIQAAGIGLSQTITYQWRKNGVLLTDAGRVTGTQTATLSIANVRPEDSGVYSVLVTETEGGNSVISNNATVKVLPPPTQFITEYPEEEVELGTPHSFTFPNYANEDVVYEWYFEETGELLLGEDTYTLEFVSVLEIDEGKYRLKITNICGELHSVYFTLKVVPVGGEEDPTSVSYEPQGKNNLLSPVPNPAHNMVTITYELLNSGNIELLLTDALGNKVNTMYSGFSNAGVQSMEFDLTQWKVSSGTYFVQLKANGFIMNNPLLIVR